VLVLEIGPRIGDDFIEDPDQRGDEENLNNKTAPPGAATKRAFQPGGELRRRWPGLDAHHRKPPGFLD